MVKFLILFLPFAVIPFTFNPQTSQQSQTEKMTIDKLDKIIRDVGKDVQQGPNIWQFTVNESPNGSGSGLNAANHFYKEKRSKGEYTEKELFDLSVKNAEYFFLSP